MAFKRPLGVTQVVPQAQNPAPGGFFKGREAPGITDVEMVEKQSGYLEAHIGGQLTSPIEWYKDNRRLSASGKFRIIASPTGGQNLGVNDVTAGDSGIYKCVGRLVGGEVVEHVWRVVVKPGEKAPPSKQLAGVQEIEMIEKQSGYLEAKVGGPLISPIEWYKDNGRISAGAKFDILTLPTGAQTLAINNVSTADTGLYKSIARLAGGKVVEHVWRVKVKPGPQQPPVPSKTGKKAPTQGPAAEVQEVE
uniref:Ig-like domain-containing protein n=1 Tax=Romanomermis culicivorax TaxID=13658 RepID=A0A915LE61_ROMCU